ncbi:MAG: hypothetical protein WBK76_00540 [Candidatus Saccharimonadales bacterium]
MPCAEFRKAKLDIVRSRVLNPLGPEANNVKGAPIIKPIKLLSEIKGKDLTFQRKVIDLLKLVCDNAMLILYKPAVRKGNIPVVERLNSMFQSFADVGWTKDQIYGEGRTLEAILQSTDSIGKFTQDWIEIIHEQGTTAKFYKTPGRPQS